MTLINALTRNALLGLLFAMMALAVPPLANANGGAFGFVGTWHIEGQPDGAPSGFSNISSHHQDGTIVNTDPTFGTGHGVWERTGKRTYSVRFVTITSPFHPIFPDTIITVTGTLALDKAGEAGAGSFETTFTDLSGNPLMPPSTGTISMVRMNLN